MTKDELERLTRSLATLKPVSASIADSLARYRDFQQTLRIHPEILESIRILQPLPIPPSFNKTLVDVSRGIAETLKAFPSINSESFKILAQYGRQFALMSSGIAETIAASALNNDEFLQLTAEMLKGLRTNREFKNILEAQIQTMQPSLAIIRASYIGSVAAQAKLAVDSDDEQEFARFEELIDALIKDPRQSSWSAKGLIILLLAILTFFLQLESTRLARESLSVQTKQAEESKTSESYRNNALEKLVRLMEDLVEKESNDATVNRIYSVQRNVVLKARPSFRSSTLGNLNVGQIVRVIPPDEKNQKFHKWLRVEALDALTGLPQYGWVNKKYLRNIKQH